VTGIVIDASVTLSWCFPDEQTPMSLNVLDRLKAGEQALVPAFWSVEVLNILLLGERKGHHARTDQSVFRHAARAQPEHGPCITGTSRRSGADHLPRSPPYAI
jgi:hypothetical protein